MQHLTVAFNVTDGVTPFRGRYALPRLVHAHLDDPASPARVEIEIEVTETGTRARQVTLTARTGQTVTTAAMRGIKIPTIVGAAMRRVALEVEEPSDKVYRITPIGEDKVEDFYTAWRRTRPSRSRLGDDHYQQVADVYRAAQQQGEPPTKTIAEVFMTSNSTAGRWVNTARKKGFLRPAPGPGKRGETEE
jgi:hypothetical protein